MSKSNNKKLGAAADWDTHVPGYQMSTSNWRQPRWEISALPW